MSVTRRRVLGQTASISLLPGLVPWTARAADAKRKIEYAHPLFTLGVASGDPLPHGIVIWTRLAPDPLNGGGMPNRPVRIRWEVAEDDQMKKIVRSGKWTARPENAHCVRREVGGLEPGRWYWYRFHALGFESMIGRTRTAPAATASPDALRLAVACCQNYEDGYYTAYRHMAAEDVDLVLHLGDYIYEGGIKDGLPRRHNSAETKTLNAYRDRYALYKLDPDLQAAHAAFPWAAVPDDHEFDNDYAGDHDEHGRETPEVFRLRRAAAYKAYYEHMPFRPAQRPSGPDMHLFRSLRFGDLATVHLLDTRQFRSPQVCGNKWSARCTEALDPARTMLGAEQESWLAAKLAEAGSRWSVLAQQVPMMQRRRPKDGQDLYHSDKWDGYVAARDRLFTALRANDVQGLISLAGDVHNNWAGRLLADFDDPDSRTLGNEFVSTSISSGGDGADVKKSQRRIRDANRHIAFYNGQRGYLRCVVGRDEWRTDFRVVPFVSKPDAPIATRASFIVERESRVLFSV
jgi:alkaline phosphatase D